MTEWPASPPPRVDPNSCDRTNLQGRRARSEQHEPRGPLRELRRRLFICLGTIVIALIPAWFAYPWLVDFLNAPYCDAQLSLDPEATCRFLETNLLDPFTLRLRIAGWGAVILAMPVILWQLWRFIAPGLYKRERRYAFAFVGSGTALFALGAAIAYYTSPRRPSS
ncbi:MAG: twin-arginine translocase subunit TatC [Microthrixaceae bacterium]